MRSGHSSFQPLLAEGIGHKIPIPFMLVRRRFCRSLDTVFTIYPQNFPDIWMFPFIPSLIPESRILA